MVICMRVKVYVFLMVSIIMLMVLPLYNYNVNGSPFQKTSWIDRLQSMYNMDAVEGEIGYFSFKAGISVEPNKTLVGKEGWLFLGNGYANTLVAKRDGVDATTAPIVASLHDSMHAWKDYLKSQGVTAFAVTIGPDKDTIYYDKLPMWNTHSANSIIKEIISKNNDVYIDTLSPLLEEKNNTTVPLYFKTDTHWNHYGAAVVFNLLRKVINDPDVVWPKMFYQTDFSVSPGPTGDLAAFLRTKKIVDFKVDIKDQNILNLGIRKIDYATGVEISSEKMTTIEAPSTPTLVISDNALSDKKVLWLRDSFGNAMSPFMSREFKQILQIHHGKVTPKIMKEMVQSFKPDYVIITVVERDALTSFFTSPPSLG